MPVAAFGGLECSQGTPNQALQWTAAPFVAFGFGVAPGRGH
jgi:hypothetical protein